MSEILVLRNIGLNALRITAVDVTYRGGSKKGIKVVGTKVYRPARTNTAPKAIARAFPPTAQIGKQWQDARGAELKAAGPPITYHLVIGFAVTAGKHRLSGVHVTYEMDGRREKLDIALSNTFCQVKSAGATSC